MSEDRKQLRNLAERATPGPWELQTSNSWRRIGTSGGRFADGDVLAPATHRGDNHPDLAGRQEDLDFIVAADPTTVLALLDEIDRLKRAAKYCEDIDATHENHRETMLYDLALERDQLRAEIERLQAENAELRQIINQSQSSCSEEIREFEKKGWHGSSGYHAGLLKAAEIASEVEGRAMTKEQP